MFPSRPAEPGAQTCQWVALHAIANGLPVLCSAPQLHAFRQHIRSLTTLLPCGCKAFLRRELARGSELDKLLEGVKSQEEAIQFVHSLHNTVNRRLRKPEISLAQAREEQQRWRRTNLTALMAQRDQRLMDKKSNGFPVELYSWRAVALFLGLLCIAILLVVGIRRWTNKQNGPV